VASRVGVGRYIILDASAPASDTSYVSITLDFDERVLASLPLSPGERERHMQIELACRYYANGWLSFALGAQMAVLDHYAFGAALAERGILRQYGMTEAMEDVAHARRQ
jgi:predicted HTH domain antitoxin